MAHHAEPMDVDCMDSDFDNKENTFHHGNVPCTEKGYEELDVSELNMKLRFSVTPASSPMSKSYTACPDNRLLEADDTLNYSHTGNNLTRSLNSTMTKNDSVIRSLKSLPLQSLHTEQYTDGNGNPSVLRQLDSTLTEDPNITVTITGTNDIDENVSLPSSSSSALHTPEATTPTKEIKDGGSPIMRGLKSVLSMFRSSQSPVPPAEDNSNIVKQEASFTEASICENKHSHAIASTPIATHKAKDGKSSKRSSPYKDSIVFNEDLEKELNWKNDTTFNSSAEKIPIHKMLLQTNKSLSEAPELDLNKSNVENNMNATVEYMDVSNNDTVVEDKTITEYHDVKDISTAQESDSEFVDCETTFSKNESYVLDVKSVQQKLAINDTFSKNDSYVLDVKAVQEILSPNLQILDVNTIAENIQNNMQSDITNVSFTDLDFKNDGDISVMPTNYADYSKCTSEILSELEKVEANISSEVDTKSNEIIMHQNNITKQLETHELASVSYEYNAEINQAEESRNENKVEIPVNDLKNQLEEKRVEPDISVVSEVDATKDINNTPVGPIYQEKAEEISLVALDEDNVKGECYAKADTSLQNLNLNQKIQNNTVLLDTTKNENVNEELISQDHNNTSVPDFANVDETVPLQIAHDNQNIFKAIDCLNVAKSHDSFDNVNNSENKNHCSVDLCSTQYDIAPPNAKIDSLNISNLGVLEVDSEKPSDVPLPDDDDAEKEFESSEILPQSTEQFVSDITSEINMAVNSSEPKPVESVIENFDNNAIDNKVNTSVIFPSLTIESHPVNDNGSSEDIIKPCENKSETLAQDEIRDKVMPEICDMSLDEEHPLVLESSGLHADVACTTMTNENEQKSEEPPFNIENNPEPVVSTDEANNSNVRNVSLSVDVSHKMTNTSGVINIIPQYEQISTQDEPMDISVNETLNITHDLPELLSQTNVVTNDDPINTIKMECNLDENKPISEPQIIESKLQVDTEKNTFIKNVDALKVEETTNMSLPDKQDLKEPEIEFHKLTKDCQESDKLSESDELPPKIFTNASICETMETANQVITVDEEVIVSPNNSPYVSLMSSIDAAQEKTEEVFEEIENPFATNATIASSPPIVSKGYNFNFDDIDDPFAMKTKIRLSPPLDTPTKSIEINDDKDFNVSSVKDKIINRRKSQPTERKRITPLKKKLNASFDAKNALASSLNKTANVVIPEDIKNNISDTMKSEVTECEQRFVKNSINDIIKPLDKSHDFLQSEGENIIKETESTNQLEQIAAVSSDVETVEESKPMTNSVVAISNEVITTSSLEQSTYFSAGASSTESIQSKNVFNLPEIDDMNFNPFATKSKVCLSPVPTDKDMDNPFATKSKIRQSPPPSIDIENPFITKSKIPESPPPDADMNSPVATKTKISNLPNESKNKPSQLELNRTTTFDESKIIQLVKDTDNEDKLENELMKEDTSANTTGSQSSKASDNQNLTTREVNTEDEDTIEGPFLDVEDDIEKMADFAVDNEDMMQFNEIKETPPGNEDNLDGEIFIDAEAFEFLLNQNKSNVVADSGKESLFLKFDPLFAKRISSDGVLAALNAHKKQSTPTKPTRPSLRNAASPIAGPSNLNVTYDGDTNISQESIEDVNITVTKPMMVVPPALNPAVTPRNKSSTPTRSNRRSITFTSPAIAVIDRLLSMSSNNSLLGQDTTITTQPNDEHSEADLALTQLRELLAEKEISVYNLRCESNDLKDRLATMENQVKNLEQEGQTRLTKINELNNRIAEKTKQNKSMAAVVEEYERTIASLIADIENDKKRHAEERVQLINERDEQTAHLTSMEVSFSDLHSKYEKSKQVILTCKANEDIYKKSIKDFEEQVTKMQANYEMLKQHATAKLNHANQELEKMNRAHEAEVVKLKAMIKRNQLLATSLQETLAQKTKANDELTAICDELINKVG